MNSSSIAHSRFSVLSALVMVQILFGAGYVVSKVVVSAFPPMVWASVRIIVSSLMMLAVTLASRRPHPKFSKKFFFAACDLLALRRI